MLQFFQSHCVRSSTTSKPGFVHFRDILTLGLAALLFFAPLSIQVRAQQPASGSKMPKTDQFIIHQNPDGEVVCREATIAERREREVNPKLLHQITHLESNSYLQTTPLGVNDLPAHLTINLRGTAQLELPVNQAAKAAFIRAAQTWENQILSPVTIYIDVDFGTTDFGDPWGAGVLGATSSPSLVGVPYQSVRNNLIASASTANETIAYNALPNNTVPTDLGDASTVSVSSSIARAL